MSTTGPMPAKSDEVSELERGAKFVLERMERDTVPVNTEYSLASIAASLKKLAAEPNVAWEIAELKRQIAQSMENQTGTLQSILSELRNVRVEYETLEKARLEHIKLKQLMDRLT